MPNQWKPTEVFFTNWCLFDVHWYFACMCEGVRPLGLELQALVLQTVGAGKLDPGLWKNSQCCCLLSHLSSPDWGLKEHTNEGRNCISTEWQVSGTVSSFWFKTHLSRRTLELECRERRRLTYGLLHAEKIVLSHLIGQDRYAVGEDFQMLGDQIQHVLQPRIFHRGHVIRINPVMNVVVISLDGWGGRQGS